ncbi:MAG: hypothetical protein CMQ38_03280 [Gammaproteobacteria bacterium]|nr:hypothetical protein [Gammaproteobacteria bacterium]
MLFSFEGMGSATSRGDEVSLLWDEKKHRRQSVAIVRGVDAKRTGSVNAENRGTALKTRAAWAWC